MNTIKFDKTRKQAKVSFLKKPVKAQTLEYFVQQNTFDKHYCEYVNHKGLTYVIDNPLTKEDDEIHQDITLQYQNAPERSRLMAGKSIEEIEAINEILADYGYNN